MAKKSLTTDIEADGPSDQDDAPLTATYTGAFNGDSLSFEVQGEGPPSELVVELNERPWGRAMIQAPLTVVRGAALPASHRLRFFIQPINQ